MTTIENNNNDINLLLKMSEYPKWYNKPGSIVRDMMGLVSGALIGIAISLGIAVTFATGGIIIAIVIGSAVVSAIVGFGISKLIPGRIGFKNRKKARFIKSYAALNLSLCDLNLKKFKKNTKNVKK